jgi:putative glutamine amidotransferase
MKKTIALTGPSSFSGNARTMIEDYLGFNFVEVYNNDLNNLQDITNFCDGLVLAGGVDLFPPFYGSSLKKHEGLTSFDPRRDIRERFLLKAFKEQNKPVLGICRGFQLICVEAGLKLILDLSFSNISHSPTGDGMKLDREFCDDSHKIMFYDKDVKSLFVNSIHHQGIEEPSKSNEQLKFIAYANTRKDKPDILEWVEGEKLVAVQFHPEISYAYNQASQIALNNFKNLF